MFAALGVGLIGGWFIMMAEIIGFIAIGALAGIVFGLYIYNSFLHDVAGQVKIINKKVVIIHDCWRSRISH